MNKKIITLLATALMLGMSACGASTPKTESAAPTETAAETEIPEIEESEAEVPETEAPEAVFEGAGINIAVLAGPTGVGASALMEDNENNDTVNHYQFTVAAANDEVVAGLASGTYDMAAIATNVASTLWNKTQGGVEICALNTRGVLYILENGEAVQSVADLKGRTIYAVGQGANPEYILEHILEKNGLTWSSDGSDADVAIEFMDSESLVSGMVSGTYDLCMLPVPAVTGVELQNPDVRTALSLTEEWNKVSEGGDLMMGCIAVRTEFAEANPDAVMQFLEEYEASIEAVQSDPETAGALCEKFGIVPKAAIATKAIPDCSLCFLAGADIQPALDPYYQVLFDANPASIGGSLPDDSIYFTGE